VSAQKDPAAWVNVSGARVADPYDPNGPGGGFTYLPREGYADYPDRYVSTRHRKREVAS
jgi:hypothetical protein